MSENISSRLSVAAIFVFMGFLMTIGMAAGTILNPDGGQFHNAIDPQVIIDELTSISSADVQMRLVGLVFDNFFIIGYMALFYGMFLLTKERDTFFPKLGFALGLTTGFCDLIENALHVALYNGVPNGWAPDPLVFANLWTFTFVKDISSYMAGFIFIIMLVVTINDPPRIKRYKLLLVIFVALYVVLGSIGILVPEFLMIRNLSFMVDMGAGAFLLNRMSKLII